MEKEQLGRILKRQFQDWADSKEEDLAEMFGELYYNVLEVVQEHNPDPQMPNEECVAYFIQALIPKYRPLFRAINRHSESSKED